ncbi:necrosis inducing protein [Biscogniauxia mediterranea]|nr:necrosis inducing protein [Biscogniauxia mediterranea]
MDDPGLYEPYKDSTGQLLLLKNPQQLSRRGRQIRTRNGNPLSTLTQTRCYNVPAVDAEGDVAKGPDHNYSGPSEDCRDASDLDNNSVYSRQRRNNGWCAYLYDYYFEKDVVVPYAADAGGPPPRLGTLPCSCRTTRRSMSASRSMAVYHKDGGTTHNFRFANEDDDNIENDKGVWFLGALVLYNGFPSDAVRDAMVNNDWGHASVAIKSASFP